MRKGIWKDVDELLSQGQVPSIVLPKAARIIGASKRPVGRPRGKVQRPVMATPAGHRLYCQAPGCTARIRKHAETIVCSERCKNELLTYSSLVVRILTGETSAREYPGYYRSTRRKRAA